LLLAGANVALTVHTAIELYDCLFPPLFHIFIPCIHIVYTP